MSWLSESLVEALIRWGRRRPSSNRGCLQRYWLIHYANPTGLALRPHHLFQSEEQTFHDHPWAFLSLILRGGYSEVTPVRGADGRICGERRQWFGAGSLLYRPAGWFHRLELRPGQSAWSLCATGRMRQAWGMLQADGLKTECTQYPGT